MKVKALSNIFLPSKKGKKRDKISVGSVVDIEDEDAIRLCVMNSAEPISPADKEKVAKQKEAEVKRSYESRGLEVPKTKKEESSSSNEEEDSNKKKGKK